jgi:hypothetical protein
MKCLYSACDRPATFAHKNQNGLIHYICASHRGLNCPRCVPLPEPGQSEFNAPEMFTKSFSVLAEKINKTAHDKGFYPNKCWRCNGKGWFDENFSLNGIAHCFCFGCNGSGYEGGKPPRTVGEDLMLIVTELAEAMEGRRHGNPPSDKIPGFSQEEEEYADAQIRLMQTAAERKYRLAEAVLAKMAYNATREHKHGGKIL